MYRGEGRGGGGVKHRRFGDEFMPASVMMSMRCTCVHCPPISFLLPLFPIDLTLESALMNHDDGAVPGPETFEWSSSPALARGGGGGGATQSGRECT
jgi:hypothetical protein